MNPTILIVDDDPAQRRLLEATIGRFGYRPRPVGSGEEAVRLLMPGRERVDAVLLDLTMPGLSGIDVLNQVRPIRPHLPILVFTAHGGIDVAVQAMRAGATDFMVKPVSADRLQIAIRQALRPGVADDLDGPAPRRGRPMPVTEILGDSRAIRAVLGLVDRAANSTIPILIEGESGVGKELIARAIHARSDRTHGPLVTVNCGAIPENLVETLLFGHEKGAFTGASERHIGKFQEASGGTLFLDEIGELRPDLQVKLLRALQAGEIDPVGSKQPVPIDIRLISATNRNLWDLVQTGQFRDDLYYRLNVFPIYVPPLRERRDDILVLAQHFIQRFEAAEGKRIEGLTEEAERLLTTYHWPGNVRQLENAIFRAVVLSDGEWLDVEHFPQVAQAAYRANGFGDTALPGDYGASPAQVAATGGPMGSHLPSTTAGIGAGAIGSVPGGIAAAAGMTYGGGGRPLLAAGAGGQAAVAASPMQAGGFAQAPALPLTPGQPIPLARLRDEDAEAPVRAFDDAGHIRSLEEIEADVIRIALRQYRGRVSEMARRLGIGRSTLYRKLRELGLDGTD
ncbi:sigma-54 dependent transcriptional regulator [Tistrella bauzanensis]|uniref:DNA-binding transcriptional regulator NtrC n=2 Tax=Tistrella arctica TaxID=3133430 RepID=A0ABU9YR91_9PROT